MYNIFFYLFLSVSLISAVIALYSGMNRLSSVTVFVLSISGVLLLINAGYIAFILVFAALLNYSVAKIAFIQKQEKNNKPTDNNAVLAIIISIFGGVLASVSGTAFWQGKVILNNEITMAGLLTNISFDYFVFFLVILSSIPLILSYLKWNNGK